MSVPTCIAHSVVHVTNHRPHQGAQWQHASTLGIAVSCRAFDNCPFQMLCQQNGLFQPDAIPQSSFQGQALGTRSATVYITRYVTINRKY